MHGHIFLWYHKEINQTSTAIPVGHFSQPSLHHAQYLSKKCWAFRTYCTTAPESFTYKELFPGYWKTPKIACNPPSPHVNAHIFKVLQLQMFKGDSHKYVSWHGTSNGSYVCCNVCTQTTRNHPALSFCARSCFGVPRSQLDTFSILILRLHLHSTLGGRLYALRPSLLGRTTS